MQAKNLAGIASVEPQVLTVSVLKNEAMSILQELAKLKFINLGKPIKKSYRKQTLSFGMWKDREDIGDASEYVRDLRRGRKFECK